MSDIFAEGDKVEISISGVVKHGVIVTCKPRSGIYLVDVNGFRAWYQAEVICLDGELEQGGFVQTNQEPEPDKAKPKTRQPKRVKHS